MFRPVSLIASALVTCLCSNVWAEEIKCSNIDAKTHYSSSSTASKTESGSSCKVSIDGANADSHGVPERMAWCAGRAMRSGELTALLAADQLDQQGIGRLMAMLVVPSIDPEILGGVDGSGIAWPSTMNECSTFLESLSGDLNGQSISNLHDELGSDFGDAALNCLFSGSGNSLIDTCDQTGSSTELGFSTSFGEHILRLPFSN